MSENLPAVQGEREYPVPAPFGPAAQPLPIWFGWDIESAAGAVLAINCKAGEDGRVEQLIGKPLLLWSAAAHPVTVEDEETGEIVNLVRVVLVDQDKKRWACASQGVWDDVRTIYAIAGPPPYEPPLACQVQQVTTRKNRRVFKLFLTADACKTIEIRKRGKMHDATKKARG